MNDKVASQELSSRTTGAEHPVAVGHRPFALGALMLLLAIVVGVSGYILYDDVFGSDEQAASEIDFVAAGGVAGDNFALDATEANSVSAPVEITETDSNREPIKTTAITARISQQIIEEAEHPLDPLLEMARLGMDYIEENIRDYEATIVKRVRWNGKLQDEEFVRCKIRHPHCDPDNPDKAIPFSVYTRFLHPKKGQEAIWVEGCHDGKIIAHWPKAAGNEEHSPEVLAWLKEHA